MKGGHFMKTAKRYLFSTLTLALIMFLLVGYATVSDQLYINGNAKVTPILPDVYITDVTPNSSAGVTLKNTNGTVFFASVTGSGTATFTIDFINISDKTYIYERVIDGAETGLEGVYSGEDIQYTVSGITAFDEIAPNGGTISLSITITVPRNVTAENYILKFNFVEKSDIGILPGNDEYDVTFKYNNGQADTVTKVHANDFIPRPETPTKSGYTFIGWYTDDTYTTAWNFEADKVTDHLTLYAGWEYSAPQEYTVTFKPNNGDADIVSVVPADSLIPLPASPTMEEYSFIGWYIDAECTNPWNFDTDKIRSDITLYGGWEIYVPPVPPDCDITFVYNNGQSDRTIIVLTGEFIPRPATPVKSGYTFIGWYIDEACTVAWNFEVNRVESHTTLYAGWKIAEYTITFQPNNDTPNTTVTVDYGTLIPIPQPPIKSGYVFIGWYTDVQCTKAWNFDTDRPETNMTLYAGWEKESTSSNEMHGDLLGLVEALLSTTNNCLNHSNIIFNAVMDSFNSKKRPKEDAPIVHCSVNSVSGGTMSAIAQFANTKLTDDLHFIFEADPDPAYRNNRMRLYMYYADDCDNAKIGDEITVYQQIVSRGSDGVWYADGTYIGVATVGNYFGGGNSGKDVKTISPYTWTSTAVSSEE